MATVKSQIVPFNIAAGVQPSTDKTPASTQHWTFSDKIRFRNGLPRKIGGWRSLGFNNQAGITGKIRSLYSSILADGTVLLVGTNTDVFSIYGSILTNISPLSTSAITIANSLETDYGTLANNPLTSVNGSPTLTVADANTTYYVAGDSVTLSGASGFAGIAAGAINAKQVIRSIDYVHNTYTINVTTVATSSTSGGGAAVKRATGRIIVSASAHGMSNGDRTKILLAATTGGVTGAQINLEFIIRNKTTGTFDIFTAGTATSAVSGGGGASTTYQTQIPYGAADENVGAGYGMGKYGVGLYGTALLSSSARSYPRIWFIDRYGENAILTPGNQGGVYEWNGDDTVAPALVANAPTAVNYAFVSNSILVTFGAAGVENHIFTSDQANLTNWTASSTNQVYENYVYGAGRLKSHVPVLGGNLIFTDSQTYRMDYIGLPYVWSITLVDNTIGLIAPMARCSVGGIAYWMGQQNFYMYDGSNITIIPSNDQTTSTIFSYVFGNLSASQKSKIFCWYNRQFDEIWFHYPSAGSSECDRIARLNRSELTWCPDTMDRTAVEYPDNNFVLPRMADSYGLIYSHEDGTDADQTAMTFTLTSNLIISGKPLAYVSAFDPDSEQVGDVTVAITSHRYPQSSVAMQSDSFTVTPTTEHVPVTIAGRYWKYTISGSSLGQSWLMGKWAEYVQESSGN